MNRNLGLNYAVFMPKIFLMDCATLQMLAASCSLLSPVLLGFN